MDERQALENDCLGSFHGRMMQAGKLHDYEKARGQSSTIVRLNPSAGEIPVDLSTHHAQAIVDVLATTETTSSTSSDEDDGSWASADFFGLDDPGALTWP
jgi:hypothetical protein